MVKFRNTLESQRQISYQSENICELCHIFVAKSRTTNFNKFQDSSHFYTHVILKYVYQTSVATLGMESFVNVLMRLKVKLYEHRVLSDTNRPVNHFIRDFLY